MEEKKKYLCSKCKFTFFLVSSRNLRCPNCGSGPELIEEVKSGNEAQRLIRDSETWN